MNSETIIAILIFACIVFICFLIQRGKTINELEKKAHLSNREIESLKQTRIKLDQEITEQKETNERLKENYKILSQTSDNYQIKLEELLKELFELRELKAKREEELKKILEGHKTAFPYLAAIMADYATYDLKILARQLDWGDNQARKRKVASLNVIRTSAKERIAEAKIATYQLDYLLLLYPSLEDILDTEEYDELDYSDKGYLQEDGDPIRNYLSREEWTNLSENERNQLALDRYVESHSKSKWQIGRDYELYVGYCYEEKGYDVSYFGEEKGLEDLGRDLICKKGGKTLIIQCKYWSSDKKIHEKHIFQLFATTVSYCIDRNLAMAQVSPLFITNICLSDEAKRVAKQLNVSYVENHPLGTFPRIKCNNGVDENGNKTKIYHLPMDQQYDRVQLIHKDDMKVATVKEAVRAGYRRAYRWSAMS